VLPSTYARLAEANKVIPVLRATRALDAMAEEEWAYHTQAIANAITGFSGSDLANRFAAVIRAGWRAQDYLVWRAASEKIDVTELLPFVKAPALVVHYTPSLLSNIDLLRELASQIPNARLVYVVLAEEMAPTIDAFLCEGEEQAPATLELPSGMLAILFADIADSTALTERLGDTAFRAKARDLDGALRTVIRDHSGSAIEGKLLGDGVLAVFSSARQAIEAALSCGHAGDVA